jgi:RHS repeat-associated protein
MHPALSALIPNGLLAAMPQLREKPHQGLPTSNPAVYLGFNVCKSTTVLGLRAAEHLERVRSRSTGKERDTESGNDYFDARYYSSAMGRFMSPDWSAKEEPVPYAKLDDPQTLNLYSYVQNNPLIRIDEDGHDALKIVDTKTGHVTILIPVHMTGRGATKERVHEILQRANHVHSEDPNVNVKVIYTKAPVNGVMNTLDISPSQNAAMCGAAGECVNHLGGNKGHIDSRNAGDDDAGPHETMHFAGAKDKYVEGVDQNGNRVTPPAPGYDGTDLMSNRPGTNLKPPETQEMQQNPTTKPCTSTNGQTKCP